MAEGRRRPYIRPAVEHRGRITERALRSIESPVQPGVDRDTTAEHPRPFYEAGGAASPEESLESDGESDRSADSKVVNSAPCPTSHDTSHSYHASCSGKAPE